jgi:hypothetical protein
MGRSGGCLRLVILVRDHVECEQPLACEAFK